MVVLHMRRLWGTLNFRVCEMKLEEAWPSSNPAEKMEAEDHKMMAVANTKSLEDSTSGVFEKVKECLEIPQSAVILRQTALKAQGPDVFMAERNGDEYTLYAIQCQHLQANNLMVIANKLRTLGIKMEVDDSSIDGAESLVVVGTLANVSAADVDIAYSGDSINALQQHLQKGGQRWTIKRILAESADSAAGFPRVMNAGHSHTYLWSREFFEPTIGVLL